MQISTILPLNEIGERESEKDFKFISCVYLFVLRQAHASKSEKKLASFEKWKKNLILRNCSFFCCYWIRRNENPKTKTFFLISRRVAFSTPHATFSDSWWLWWWWWLLSLLIFFFFSLLKKHKQPPGSIFFPKIIWSNVCSFRFNSFIYFWFKIEIQKK